MTVDRSTDDLAALDGHLGLRAHGAGAAGRRYVVVSPVKDESRFVERTLRSMAAQTHRPERWVIVDDASSDGTLPIVESFAREHAWIRVVRRQQRGAREPGAAVMHAFYAGLALAREVDHDYVVKLDCDVDLPPDYFGRILHAFDARPRLGIASGVYLEEGQAGWTPIRMPEYHAAGACKVIRRRCFDEIGGFVSARGWDTVDEIRARSAGWATTHFPDLEFLHLKPEGSGIGSVRTCVLHGDVHYVTGGGLLFLAFKCAHRMVVGKPPVVGGLAIAYGYLRAALRPCSRLVSQREAREYQRLLNRRLVPRRTRPHAAPTAVATERL